jgi:hypothetical protein
MRAPWVLVCAAIACAARAGAQETPEGARRVDLHIAALEPQADAMEKVARELLGRLDVDVRVTRIPRLDLRVVVTPQPDADPAVARVWIDLMGEGPATLYVVDAPWERVLVRHLPPASDEVLREAVGHILETAVDALLRGGHLGVEREKLALVAQPAAEAPPLLPPRAPRPSPENLFYGELGASYEAQLFGRGGVVRQGPEASVFAGIARGRIRPGVWASVQYRFPVVVEDAPVGLRFDSVAVRALAVADVGLTNRLAMRLGVGGGLEFDRVTPRVGTDSAVQIGQAESDLIPVARISFGARLALREHFALDFGAAMDVDFTGTRYLAVGGGTSVVDFAPWAVRPALFLGVDAR